MHHRILIFLVAALVACVTRAETVADAAAPEAVPVFTIEEFRVAGNSVLPATELERLLYPGLGPDKQFADVEAARALLEQYYRDKGFPAVSVYVPQQRVDSGVITLEVVERKVGAVHVFGSKYHSPRDIKARIGNLQSGQTLYVPAVQQDLSVFNSFSQDRFLAPAIHADAEPDKVAVDLRLQDSSPLHAGLQVNDRASENTSASRASGYVSYDNLWQLGHALNIGYQISPDERGEVRALSVNYLARFPGSSRQLALFGVSSHSSLVASKDIGIIGNGEVVGLRAINPVAQDAADYANFNVGLDFKNMLESIRLRDQTQTGDAPQGGDTSIDTPIDYLAWSLQYVAGHVGADSRWQASLGPGFAFRGLGNSDKEFNAKRYGARANFIYLRGDAHWRRDLWLGTRAALSLSGQLTHERLISNEEFSVGGMDTVRGYYEAQVLGDNGVQASLELHSPSLSARQLGFVDDAYALLFIDGGAVRLQQPLPSQDQHNELSSTGWGLRLGLWRMISLQVYWAQAIKAAGSVDAHERRSHFNLEFKL